MADEQQPSSSPLDSDFLMTALTEDGRIDEPVDAHFVDSTQDDYGRLQNVDAGNADDTSEVAPTDYSPVSAEAAVESAAGSRSGLSDRQMAGLAILGGDKGPVASSIYDTGHGDTDGAGDATDDDLSGQFHDNPGPKEETSGGESSTSEEPGDGATKPRGAQRRGKQMSPRSRIGLIIAAVIGLVLVFSLVVKSCMAPGDEPPKEKALPFTAASAPAKPTATDGPAVADGPIAIESAEGVGCQPGSTNGMSALDDNPDTAWVCVVKAGSAPVPKMLRVKFKGSFIVVGVSVIPGFERKNSDGSDEWIKHQVVSEIAYTFNDTKTTRYTQQTLSLRSGARTAINPPLLASAMVIDVNKYAAPAGSSGTPGGPTQAPDTNGAIPNLNGPQPGKEAAKPTDFAISAIVIYGHRPA